MAWVWFFFIPSVSQLRFPIFSFITSMFFFIKINLNYNICFKILAWKFQHLAVLELTCHLFLSACVKWYLACTLDIMASQVALVVKNPLANAGDIRHMGSIPGSGRCPGGGSGNPLQYSGLEYLMDRGAWWAMVHRVAKS